MDLDVVAVALRFALACVFLVAGLSKITFRREFQEALSSFSVIPRAVRNPLTVAVPAWELALALALVGSPVASYATGLSLATCLLFACLLAHSLATGQIVKCGCFGRSSRDVGWSDVLRNVLLCCMASGGFVGSFGKPTAAEMLCGALVGISAAAGVALISTYLGSNAVRSTEAGSVPL